MLFDLASLPGVMQWYCCERKMDPFDSALILDISMCRQRKIRIPLPRIQEGLESMAGAAHFSTMDFKSGFWQVRMTPELQQYTMFMVGNLGFYEFTRMPFGLCNTPVMFQHLMQNTLEELNLTYCIIYLDDVISLQAYRRRTPRASTSSI